MRIGLPKWLFNRQLGRTLGWIALIVFVAVAVNLVGIRLVGDAHTWSRWLDEHAGYFLVWRLCLYGATAYGWIWMRRRLRERDTSREAHQRLLRAEVGAVAAIVLLEISVLLRQP
ncbi:MAG: hypothetical protein Q8L60_03020 [Gammaproteobacteria bacterium]|uniref:Uncharacterized protein n=1 Tax=Thioalkalivibrio sulfidiphilus (strain HL-EbGR7) TaxID=396588 RepID=B8GNP7_THISH|nr:hypothetical protein [Thioalkalivibrio sulfidiphilus]ACL73938.1 conserved hypothetical protein [Thioalkalivibrio sulfidiphilus HL-EbGr7]MDO9521830.1 hypothetical protein [Pseudohongiella sp.]MDP1930410.1 hypothetical protein [Gammaproteobacteria bacterium]MDP2348758.1 hypothetical protein [Gammaproteobacteria bacterium]